MGSQHSRGNRTRKVITMSDTYKITTTNPEGKVISELTLKFQEDMPITTYMMVGSNAGNRALMAIRDDYEERQG